MMSVCSRTSWADITVLPGMEINCLPAPHYADAIHVLAVFPPDTGEVAIERIFAGKRTTRGSGRERTPAPPRMRRPQIVVSDGDLSACRDYRNHTRKEGRAASVGGPAPRCRVAWIGAASASGLCWHLMFTVHRER
jgi:hypothetical protein